MSKEEAEAYCQSLGGHLAVADSESEQAFLEELIAENGKRKHYLLGAEGADNKSNADDDIDTIENTMKQGNYIHFDLTNMQGIEGILNGTRPYMNRTTSGELIYIRDNWDRLSGNIKFYNNGEEVLPPWLN